MANVSPDSSASIQRDTALLHRRYRCTKDPVLLVSITIGDVQIWKK